jgi:hypothetical protein
MCATFAGQEPFRMQASDRAITIEVAMCSPAAIRVLIDVLYEANSQGKGNAALYRAEWDSQEAGEHPGGRIGTEFREAATDLSNQLASSLPFAAVGTWAPELLTSGSEKGMANSGDELRFAARKAVDLLRLMLIISGHRESPPPEFLKRDRL